MALVRTPGLISGLKKLPRLPAEEPDDTDEVLCLGAFLTVEGVPGFRCFLTGVLTISAALVTTVPGDGVASEEVSSAERRFSEIGCPSM